MALATTASPEETATVGLWCSKDLPRLAGAAGPDPGALVQMKQSRVLEGRIKHVLTIALGKDFVHYFVEETKANGIGSLFVGKQGDGFCLSQGPGGRRVRRLL
jgi:hypothetical protein